MIFVVVVTEKDDKGREHLIVSHGIDSETDKMVVMPQMSPQEVGSVYKKGLGWVIE